VRIKVCGITNVSDARVAVEAGVDAIGLVFYEPSPRNIADLDVAQEIALSVGPFVTVVALFVNPTVAFVQRILKNVPLHILQFHGDEEAEFCKQFNRPYMKALRMKEGVDVNAQVAQYPCATGILLDAYKKGVPGGTGETFDWARVPEKPLAPIVLAGGLTPNNIAKAVLSVGVYGVDVSGGVELSPGVKDKNKIKAFVDNAKVERLSE